MEPGVQYPSGGEGEAGGEEEGVLVEFPVKQLTAALTLIGFYSIWSSDKEDFWESIFSFLSVPALKKERENTQRSPVLLSVQFSSPC